MSKFWDSEKTIAVIPVGNKGDEIQVKITTKAGRTYCDVRRWYPEPDFAEMRPTQKGIALPEEVLGKLISALSEATQYLAKKSLDESTDEDVPF